MDPITLGLIIGGTTGLAKGLLVDSPRASRQRKLQAETTRYSPWTGLTGQAPQEADLFGSTMQGLTGGAMLGGSISSANKANALTDAQTAYLDAKTKAGVFNDSNPLPTKIEMVPETPPAQFVPGRGWEQINRGFYKNTYPSYP